MIHPELFHPMILHFPIVLVILLLVSDGVALVRGVPLSGTGGYAIVSMAFAVLAGASAAVTALLGDLAAETAMGRGVAEAIIEPHEELGSTTAIILVAWAVIRAFVWWRGIDVSGKRVMGVVGAEVVMCGLIVVTAYLGGQLVYEQGVNILTTGG